MLGSAWLPLGARGAAACPRTERSLCLGVLFCCGCQKRSVAHADSPLAVGKRPPALVSQPGVAGNAAWGLPWVTCCGAAGERLQSRAGSEAEPAPEPRPSPCHSARAAFALDPCLPQEQAGPLSQFPHCFQMMKMFLSLGFSSAFIANDWRSAMKYNSSRIPGGER